MLSICLCDDDINMQNFYLKKINELLDKREYEFHIETFTSGESLVFELEETPNKFNILIVDIIMKDMNGIEAAKKLREYGYEGIVLFLTSNREFALDSFEAEPLGYILKDTKDNKFDEVFLKAVQKVKKECEQNIVVSTKYDNKIISIDVIAYMESWNKKVILHRTTGEAEQINYRLSEIYEKVEKKGFIQCHKSYIINAKYLETFNAQECCLKNNIRLPMGRKYMRDFKEKLLEKELGNLLV